MLVLPLRSRRYFLRMLLRHSATLHLFVNDLDLDNASLTSLKELVGHGYRPKDLFSNAWTIDSEATAKHPKVTWVFDGGEPKLIHGYYVVWKADGTLAWAEKFSDGPYRIRYRGDTLKVSPRLTLDVWRS